ncbi:MAG TPA: helix-turn-helix domain-containing protein [Prosthecobacter sp.]
MPQAASSKSKAPAVADAPERRSQCPVACSLDIFGDRWTLLVVRDLVLGHSRFGEFVSSPEGIPTNILSDRLEKLQQHDIIQQRPATQGGKRMAYELTEKGRALLPILRAMRDWGLAWEPGTEARQVPIP